MALMSSLYSHIHIIALCLFILTLMMLVNVKLDVSWSHFKVTDFRLGQVNFKCHS